MRLRLFVSAFASCGAASVSAAQPNPSVKADQAEPLPSIFAPRAAAPDAKPERMTSQASSPPPPGRAISPEMTAKLSAFALRTRPVPPANARASDGTAAKAEDSFNGVRLKPFVVQEDRLPRFKERDLLTSKGKLELARRHYPGLGPLGDAEALRRLEEDFARERRQEMVELRGLLEIGGGQLGPELKKNFDQGLTRPAPRGLPPEFLGPFRLPK